MKMKFKVSELVHVFMNSAAPDGAQAGEHAYVKNEVLFHSRRTPAAAFLADIEPLTVITFTPTDKARWSRSELKAAVPPTLPLVEIFAHLRIDGEERSAEFIVDKLLERATERCKAFGSGELDTYHTNRTFNAAAVYLRDVATLLALNWKDLVAKYKATQTFEALKAKYMLNADFTAPNLVVHAISRREWLEKESLTGKQYLTDYAQDRKAVSTIVQVHEFTRRYQHSKLTSSIASILAVELPTSYYGQLAFKTLADYEALQKRSNNYTISKEFFPNLKRAWKGYVPNNYDNYPLRWKNQIKEAMAFSDIKRNRKNKLNVVANFQEVFKMVQAFDWTLLDDQSKGSADVTKNILEQGRTNYINARQLITQYKLINPACKITLFDDAQETIKKFDAAIHGIKAKALLQEALNAISKALDIVPTMPRKAKSDFNEYYFTQSKLGAEYQQLKTHYDSFQATIEQTMLTVTVEQEYLNGGDAPRGRGDWLRAKGESTQTTRGVTVKTRDAVRMLRMLDSLEPIEQDFRDRRLMIGPYQLLSRQSNGTVIVGCHTFSAEAIELYRSQVTEIAEVEAA